MALIPDASISGVRITREVDRLFAKRDKLGTIVSDSGIELTYSHRSHFRRMCQSRNALEESSTAAHLVDELLRPKGLPELAEVMPSRGRARRAPWEGCCGAL